MVFWRTHSWEIRPPDGFKFWSSVAFVALMAAGTPLMTRAAAPAEETPAPATAPATQPAGLDLDGDPYPVSKITIHYVTPRGVNDARPSEESLAEKLTIELGEVEGVYVVPPSLENDWRKISEKTGSAPRPFVPRHTVRMHLSELPSESHSYYNSAIWAIDEQIRRYFVDRMHLLGVFVIPSPADIEVREPFGDLRKTREESARTRLSIWVYTGSVGEVRTIGSGPRTPPNDRINNPVHGWIREHSPVQREAVAASQPTTAPNNPVLLRRDLLDDYVSWLNRHPGRHVDIAISGITPTEPGAVSLDYLVTEARPWSAYFQVSNTGTKETDAWRERFGYVNNQLFNRDDSFSLDYTTAAFRVSQDIAASYELPITPSRKLRLRAYGDYDEFTASDVGFGKQRFKGEQQTGGAEVAWNFYQVHDAFFDLVAGARYENVSVTNHTAGVNTKGSADFAVPYVGLRFDRITDIASTTADVMFQGRFTNASVAELNKLGRLSTDTSSVVLQGGLTESFFLEPLLFPKAFDEARSTLAHEIVLSVRGQYAFGNRLIPQAEEVAGGLYSVRGYPESVSSGDSVIIASAEYRFHLPRAKPFEPAPTSKLPNRGSDTATNSGQPPFRWQPQQAYGRPDWDLLFRGFLDVGQTYNSKKLSFENDNTLVGTGLGVELDLKQNFSVRVDWGIPLNEFSGGPKTGESRVHVSATLLY